MADVLIVGAGLAGAAAATVLGRQGIDVVLVDEVDPLPYCFRAEKLSVDQVDRFHRLGLGQFLEESVGSATAAAPINVGREASAPAPTRRGMFYHDLVNAVRRQLPTTVDFRIGKVRELVPGAEQHRVILADGSALTARLLVVAAGNSGRLLAPFGIRRQVLSRMHSIAFGFNVAPRSGGAFPFEDFVYPADHTTSRISFISLFRIGATMRANLFAYWDAEDGHVQEFLGDPITALERLLPGFVKVTGPLRLVGEVDRRPSHLQRVEAHEQAGLVLIGDAFQVVCPASGTGITKLLNDVELLCQSHLPHWLSTPGMGAEKIRQFYADPAKIRCDHETLQESLSKRQSAVDAGFRWRWKRLARCWKRTALAWWDTSSARRPRTATVARDGAIARPVCSVRDTPELRTR